MSTNSLSYTSDLFSDLVKVLFLFTNDQRFLKSDVTFFAPLVPWPIDDTF